MSEELKPGPIKGAHVRQSLLLGTWQIRTGERVDNEGWITARNTYPIPDETLEQIALDWIVKQAEGYEKGYEMELYGKIHEGKREKFKFRIEKEGFVEAK